MADRRTSRVLVTGGAGFIGSHLVDLLLDGGHHVVVVDDLSTGRLSNLEPARARSGALLDFVHSDLGRWIEGEGADHRFDRIFHLAAAVGVKLVVQDPIGTIETNVHQTSAVLEFANAGSTPLLVASTSEVYGKGVNDVFSEDDDLLLGPTTRSRWSYACSKAIDEYLALAHHEQRGLPVSIVRFFNTIGPRQVGDYGMVVPRFVARALAGDPIEVYGDGEQSRCFCDVRDAVRALPEVLDSPACLGRVVNLGSDSPISMNGLAQLVKDVLESDSEIVHVPYEQAYSEGFEDLRSRVPDLSRIRTAIGFSPAHPLHRTISDLARELQGASSRD